ncbi:MAG: energy-coupling factor ABC transporter permease [Humidesulfovibrio sp.]|uniref:energy-coupling factor ABC transporter permease n=1 Tax=Humidesulfovibrio sp. TaxID=2910988 RepID=UPI0027FBC8C9|nr:energy-coupling factor ABC transporter permease [Humidesulfovibrio sp.]MDQ7834034.1 energy-coupling factor ABC transporter permease [Humidesulfovibrio sp.]
MADALLSPAVGGTMWAASAGLLAYSSSRLKTTLDDNRVPLMGVLAAFVFAAQMINFSIPGTGSSGHLGGGLILAVLLGPHAAFLSIASVLAVQALFFADGGLLALGCNIFNLGFFPCFLCYPFIFKPLAGEAPSRGRLMTASVIAAVVGLQMGAFGVVLETVASGISELPFNSFVLLMQPIHLAIGLVEGVVTAALLVFLHKARPELFGAAQQNAKTRSLRPVIVGLALAAMVVGGGLSWFAAGDPDGLEWSMAKVSGKEELEAPEHGIHSTLGSLQKSFAFLPDYNFKEPEATATDSGKPEAQQTESWPNVSAGTSISGLLGGFMTLCLAGLVALLLRRRAPSKA